MDKNMEMGSEAKAPRDAGVKPGQVVGIRFFSVHYQGEVIRVTDNGHKVAVRLVNDEELVFSFRGDAWRSPGGERMYIDHV
jgi:hypothetical protein